MKGAFKELTATAVVVDSDPLSQHALVTMLSRWNIEVVAVSAQLERAAELAGAHACELLLVSVEEGTDNRTLYRLLRRLHKHQPDLATIVFAEHDVPGVIEAALAAGAYAAVDRWTREVEVARIIDEALAVRSPEGGVLGETGVATRARLTRREIETLRLVAEGRSNREVAKLLWVTDQTVKFHLANTYRKLSVRNRFEASQWAAARGLVNGTHTSVGRGRGLEGATRQGRPATGAVMVTP